jgi:hypothetical protein
MASRCSASVVGHKTNNGSGVLSFREIQDGQSNKATNPAASSGGLQWNYHFNHNADSCAQA